jgi:hypothetical protein
MILSYKLEQLSEDQLSLLVHTFKDILTDADGNIMTCRLKAINLRTALPKLHQIENQLTEEGEEILKSLITILNFYP